MDKTIITEADRKTDDIAESYLRGWNDALDAVKNGKFVLKDSSEKPNNCEHITEDGVTCAKYPACDDCLDNPLNKVKGSERLVKGKDEPQTIIMVKDHGRKQALEMINLYHELKDEPQTETSTNSEKVQLKVQLTDEPQTDCGDFADRLAYERGVKHAWEVAQKVFASTLTFYEAEDVAKQIDKDINVRSKDEPQTERSE